MTSIVIVGVGGLVGSVFRHLLGGWVAQLTPQAQFPVATLVVNLAGCLVMGVLAGVSERIDWPGPATRLLLVTGLLGGFTTFSSFSLQTLDLLRGGEPGRAALYVLGSVALCLLGAWAGHLAAAGIGGLRG